ncbi:unnamed protein product [Malus baccata var. baccata]
MTDCGARSSKTMDGEGSGKAAVWVRHTYGGSHYRITADKLIGVVKLDMRTSFWSDVGVLVLRAIPKELKMHLIDELVPHWDINKSNPNLMKAIDNIFKSRFQEWKFDNLHATELQREPEL